MIAPYHGDGSGGRSPPYTNSYDNNHGYSNNHSYGNSYGDGRGP